MSPYHYTLGIIMLLMSAVVHSVTIDLTAEFTPKIHNTNSDGVFTNTTPNSGYCARWPQHCNSDELSVGVPLILNMQYSIPAFNEPRKGIYFGLPKTEKSIIVTNNKTGESFNVVFKITNFSANVNKGNDINWLAKTSDLSSRTNWYYPTDPGTGCTSGSFVVGNINWLQFIWKTLNNTTPCYLISTIERVGRPSQLSDLSIGYSLQAKDNLLTVGSGNYVGKLSFTVGPGGDFDFGDNYQASDSVVDINLTLSVNHDLIVTTTPESRALSLQPCSAGKVCTEEQGKRNWERWMITKITPQLTARSDFLLSSTGAFTAYLQCEYIQGEHCAIKSDNNGQLVPVKAYLSLPNNIINQKTNNTVSHAPMLNTKDLANNTFLTRDIGSNRKGSIDFLVTQHDVDTMLLIRPDTYRGTVTVIFDPKIY